MPAGPVGVPPAVRSAPCPRPLRNRVTFCPGLNSLRSATEQGRERHLRCSWMPFHPDITQSGSKASAGRLCGAGRGTSVQEATPGMAPHGTAMTVTFLVGARPHSQRQTKKLKEGVNGTGPTSASSSVWPLVGERTGISDAPGPQDSQPPCSGPACQAVLCRLPSISARSSPDLGPGPHSLPQAATDGSSQGWGWAHSTPSSSAMLLVSRWPSAKWPA
ncbi:uncharacterized protein LOC132478202 isoform X1 [Mesoplodon densirostris]|uniref:uncharacterized protein LOC132478202 isoform X1 n=1 Tax=Mesoplodon densirostris TaxID=48708 RepID=UPI0028DB2D4F|nr:uncharacterized protein LOC132478202 isoform X1 [Mesoplodon densirostris]